MVRVRYAEAVIKGVCFDLDGTLAHYDGDFEAFGALLRSELGLQMCDMNEFSRLLGVALARDGALNLAGALGHVLEQLDQRPPADLAVVAAAAAQAYAEDVRPYHGARELLVRLDAAGVRLALLSNGPEDMQKAALAALGFAEFFRVVLVSGDRDVAARKPAPRIFSLACTGLQCLPEELVMVGDNPGADIGGALAYDMNAVLLDHAGEVKPDSLPEGVPVACSLAELDELLKLRYKV